MTEPQLLAAYRNLLIQLAQHYVTMLALTKTYRVNAQKETVPGRISGLYCYARVVSKQSAMLKELLMEDRKSLNHFFGTTNLHVIAKQSVT